MEWVSPSSKYYEANPKNEWTSFGVFGTGQSLTLLTFSGFGEIPSLESIWPKNKTLV